MEYSQSFFSGKNMAMISACHHSTPSEEYSIAIQADLANKKQTDGCDNPVSEIPHLHVVVAKTVRYLSQFSRSKQK